MDKTTKIIKIETKKVQDVIDAGAVLLQKTMEKKEIITENRKANNENTVMLTPMSIWRAERWFKDTHAEIQAEVVNAKNSFINTIAVLSDDEISEVCSIWEVGRFGQDVSEDELINLKKHFLEMLTSMGKKEFFHYLASKVYFAKQLQQGCDNLGILTKNEFLSTIPTMYIFSL